MTARLKQGAAKHTARSTTKPSLQKARPAARKSTVSSTAKHGPKHGFKHNVGNGEARFQARATAVSSTYGLRGDDEIRALADERATRWKQGDGVEPFLRLVEPELSTRVRHARWSWESVARALNVAGIRYRTQPWTGVTLASKIRTVRHETRLADRRAGQPTGQSPDRRLPPDPPVVGSP